VPVLCLVQFFDVLGVTVVVTALPRMLSDLGASASAGTLISTGYAMAFGGLLMLGARLGDRFGHRRAILASLAVFAAGSVTAAVAGSVLALTAGRCLQGAAAALSVPSALRLLTTLTKEGAQRSRAIAAWSAAGAVSGASGFVVGGVITDLASWRWIFIGYVPLAAGLCVVIARLVPHDAAQSAIQSLNIRGALLLTTAVMAVVGGSTLLGERTEDGRGLGLLCAAVVLAIAFVWVDRRARSPLLPGALLGIPAHRLGVLASFLNTFTTSSVITLATLYLQGALGRSPIATGATFLPFSAAVVVGATVAAPALRRATPAQVAAGGLFLIALANCLVATAVWQGWELAWWAAVGGAGLGLSSVAATTLGTDVAAIWRGTASGIVNTAAQIGTALGVAALLLLASTVGSPSRGVSSPALQWGALAAAGVAAAGAVRLALFRSRD
jgi:MFS family permease